MLSFNEETIPVKEDTCIDETCVIETFTPTSATVGGGEKNAEAATTTTTNSTTTATTISNGMANSQAARFQFGQKAKLFRDMFTQHKIKLDNDHTQLLIIIFMSTIAVVASLAALTTNNWTCDGQQSFGLWNTCHKPLASEETIVINLNTSSLSNETSTAANETSSPSTAASRLNGIMCAKQTLYEVRLEYAEQSRIDQVTASQGLMVCGTILYILSVVSLTLAYKFIKVKNLNSLRNALVTSMFVQIISFFMQLIGFFLFILTDRLSISIGLLFIYFGLALFATNIINFITIEYKSYKMRHVSI
jgi:hypothetical protein